MHMLQVWPLTITQCTVEPPTMPFHPIVGFQTAMFTVESGTINYIHSKTLQMGLRLFYELICLD